MNNNELKEIDIKNCTCQYFDDIIKIKDLNLYYTLLDEILKKIILIYDVA